MDIYQHRWSVNRVLEGIREWRRSIKRDTGDLHKPKLRFLMGIFLALVCVSRTCANTIDRERDKCGESQMDIGQERRSREKWTNDNDGRKNFGGQRILAGEEFWRAGNGVQFD